MDRKRGVADGGTADSAGGIVSESTLDGFAGRGSTADADDPQPDRGQAASTTSSREGGGA